MFRFEEPLYLYLLVLVPLILGLFFLLLQWKKARLNKFGDPEVVKRLMPEWSVKREWLKTGLFSSSLLFLLIAMANPQWGTRSQLIKNLKGERLGLIFFAGSAYLQMPLTGDYAATELFIKSANPKQAGTQGTVITDAINLTESIFSSDSPYQKALVLITDGENHESEAIEAARQAAKDGTFIFCIGVGSQEGAPVPFKENGKEYYKKDKSGFPIKSKLNVALLQEIAEAANGKFYLLDDGFSLTKKIVNDLSKIEKQEVEQRSFTDYNSYFQYLLGLALLALIFESFISNKSDKIFEFKKWFGL